DLDDVEPQLPALADVAVDRVGALRQHVLDEPAGRNEDVVGVTQVDEFLDGLSWHESEGAAGKLERGYVSPRRLQDVFKVALAHRRVIRPTDLRDAPRARLGRARVDLQEGERSPPGGGW